jgi:hypothetical protein
MSDVETADAPLTAAEIAALNTDVARRLRDRDRVSAARVAARPNGASRNGSRRPLGLRPVGAEDLASERDLSAYGEPDLDRGPIINLEEYSQEFRDAAATVGMAYFCLNTAASLTESLSQKVKARIGEVRSEVARIELENAQLRASVAELKAKVGELTFVSERLRIEARGPAGERRPMGRDGPPGPRGERGSQGERGQAAPVVIEWRPDPEAFTIQAILSDGSAGPMIALRSLFESYHSATSWIEDADIVQAAHEARVENERQIEASCWAK